MTGLQRCTSYCVWLTIMGSVIFLLEPVLRNRDSAKQPSCQSNLRQMANAFAIYTQDHDGFYPPASKWQDCIYPFLKFEGAFICPDSPETVPGYAFNLKLHCYPEARLSSPGAAPMLWDSLRGVRNAADRLQSYARRHGGEQPAWWDRSPERTSGGGNIAFADGHVKFVPVPPPAERGIVSRSKPAAPE